MIRFLRLDKYLIDNGMASTGTRARELITGGFVKVNDVVITSSLCPIAPNQKVTLLNMEHPWVSDDGKKLDHVIKKLSIDVKARVAVDIGAGIGGFSDVLLAKGVKKIYAIDKEFGLLHTSLILNERVKNLDRLDIKTAGPSQIDSDFNLILYDLPEENITEILPSFMQMAQAGSDLIACVRPFGDLENTSLAYKRYQKMLEHWLRGDQGWIFKKIIESPSVTNDPAGREFFIWAQKPNT